MTDPIFHDSLTSLFHGDCIDLMREWPEDRQVDLIFADPPFNWDRPYDVCDDKKAAREYSGFTHQWMYGTSLVLRPGGHLWVNIPDEHCYLILKCARDLGYTMQDWCIWHYRFGQHTSSKFIRSKVHALHFIKPGGPVTWNPNAVLEPSDRASKYADPRTTHKVEGTPGLRVPLDVWYGENWGRVQGNNRERRHLHDNQLPELYLHRVIASCTNEGDMVLDPFLGSGTTGVVARALNRRFIGCDLSLPYVESARTRILEGPARPLPSPPTPPSPTLPLTPPSLPVEGDSPR